MEFSSLGFSDKFVKDVTLRLKRVEGQVRALRTMIEHDRDCEEIVQQVSAATRALDRLGVLILTTAMQACIRKEMTGERVKGYTAEKVQRLFLNLR